MSNLPPFSGVPANLSTSYPPFRTIDGCFCSGGVGDFFTLSGMGALSSPAGRYVILGLAVVGGAALLGYKVPKLTGKR